MKDSSIKLIDQTMDSGEIQFNTFSVSKDQVVNESQGINSMAWIAFALRTKRVLVLSSNAI